MAVSLQDLIANLPGQMTQQILTPEQQQARIDAQVAANMPAMLRQYGKTTQDLLENTFARGMGTGPIPTNFTDPNAAPVGGSMGISTWLAQQLAPLQAQQTEAAARIRQDAQNAVDSAQRSAIANAAQYATGEQNRQQQASLNRSNQRQATSLQNRNMLYGGLGNLVGGGLSIAARDLTRPAGTPSNVGSAYDRIKELFGGSGAGTPQVEQPPSMTPLDFGSAGDMAAANTPSYNLPDMGGGPDYSSYSPSTFNGADWSNVNVPDFSLNGLLNWTMPSSSYDSNWDWSF